MTSKERSRLKSMANGLQPVTQIGKGGLSDNLIEALSEALEARELIKVNILETADSDADNVAQNAADLLGAQVVAVIGRKAIFYRRSSKKEFQHIVF
ncbi:MAG: YhbY family RNA-binding protein [Clostridia bacterium]|mgnify:CR=1 FL=1|jgi:RNA-binding protein|nr:YhbY family RNA-binding protein [Clostridia bacterium]